MKSNSGPAEVIYQRSYVQKYLVKVTQRREISGRLFVTQRKERLFYVAGRQGFASLSHHRNVNELAALLHRDGKIDAIIPSSGNSNKLFLKRTCKKMEDNPLRVALLPPFLL